jgi:hypothetical protein
MWRRNWAPYENAPGIYATRAWVSLQPTGARLQQIYSTTHKYKLDNGSMGASKYVQGCGRGRWVVATRSQHTARYCDHVTLVSSGRFTNKELKEINYCRIYLQTFFISDIKNLEGNKIEEWAGRVQRQVGHQSSWDWHIKQWPIAWEAWKMALEHLAPNAHIGEAMGDWRHQHHQITEWYLDAHICIVYHHVEWVWTRHDATNMGRLRFQVDAHSCDAPKQYSHMWYKYASTRDAWK